MHEEEIIYELIARELTSDISDQEKELLQSQMALHPEIHSKFNAIEKYWNTYFPNQKSNQTIKKTNEKLGFSEDKSNPDRFLFFYRIAIAIIVIVSLSYVGFHRFQEKPQISLNEYYANPGKVECVVLADGTKVWLNSHSLLIASEPFTKKNREVMLFGEGYFEVAHIPDQPFIVKTASLRTKVLGTHFNISAYPDDRKQEISLYEGSIELSEAQSSKKSLRVNPGEKVCYTDSSNEFNVIKTDLGKPAQWRDGILRFYDEDFASITKKLERKFQTKIVFTDKTLGNLHFTANFEEESLMKILDLLKEAHEFKYKKYENNIIIQSKNI